MFKFKQNTSWLYFYKINHIQYFIVMTFCINMQYINLINFISFNQSRKRNDFNIFTNNKRLYFKFAKVMKDMIFTKRPNLVVPIRYRGKLNFCFLRYPVKIQALILAYRQILKRKS